ncbi:hypothetical protein P3X46_027433 [Hevea brasiliensis]|uniref:Uncharacterized protein n=1 Tax=Hevea brasiliensis TaxID=3981 RepID=A0ABQ9KZU9_HEVBR|nr:hypothetical protein P3X46_027433 [Hevea brasiliensis]
MDHPERPVRASSLKLEMLPLLRPKTIRDRKSATAAIAAAAAGGGGGVPLPPLDLTEDNIRQVIADARVEERIVSWTLVLRYLSETRRVHLHFGQLFDTSVGMTAELAELDGYFVKISLRGRLWHKTAAVLARLGNYLKQRIPVDIEDEKQLDSPENF